jgi:resuscitation-promoting factor RpfA
MPPGTATPPATWDKIAACESGGDWNTNTGNGYYGGLQFNTVTWHNYGGHGLPHQASKATQVAIAEKVLAEQGWDAWPVCSRKAGLH